MSSQHRSLNIVIADDDPDLLDYYECLLTHFGHSIVGTARDGREAIETLENPAIPPPDVLLLDHRMPGMSGIEAARYIIREMPSIPIMILSADESIELEARLMGVRRFIKKPFDADTLISALKELS